MAKNNIRVTLNFTVDVENDILFNHEQGAPYYDEYLQRSKRQKCLLDAILSDKEHFHALLQERITAHFDCMTSKDWHELLMSDEKADIEDVLKPVIALLEKTDRAYFIEASKEDAFYESVEEVLDCFTTKLEEVSITVEVEA